MAEWRFPSNDHGEIKGLNDSGVSTFRGTPLKSLAREICQNSLDASLGSKVTKVEFNMFKIQSRDLPDYDGLLDALERSKKFWNIKETREFFDNAIKIMKNDNCFIMRISDFNTTGLTGSRGVMNTDWTNLTKSSGASDKKGTAGGSYGIGKFAPFACSEISTVFYSTYDKNGERAHQGVSRLVTFEREDGEQTNGTGYYGNDKNTPEYSELELDPTFCRSEDEYGTDIYIIGYKYNREEWEKKIIISVLDGFLGALWNEKLVVKVGDKTINKDSIKSIIDLYDNELTGYTKNYFKVLTSDKTRWYEEDFWGMGNIKVGLLLDDQFSSSRVAMIRKTGMKIMDKDRLSGNVPFSGIMFIEGDSINEELRKIENPEHTRWEPDRSPNPMRARQILRNLNEFIKDKINDIISTGSDEEIDAVGVGDFLPDEIDQEADEQSKDEVVSDKIEAIESNEVKRRSTPSKNEGKFDSSGELDELGTMKRGGDDEDWFHGRGKSAEKKSEKQPAHREKGEERGVPTQVGVAAQKMMCMCIDKKTGRYMLSVTPSEDGEDGIVKAFLSAETQKYEAPIKRASLLGKQLEIKNNTIKGLSFRAGEALKLALELDYHDYCSMEVELYAVKK